MLLANVLRCQISVAPSMAFTRNVPLRSDFLDKTLKIPTKVTYEVIADWNGLFDSPPEDAGWSGFR